MNTLNPSASQPPPDPPDLDARILHVEHRLIAREQALRRGLQALGRRTEQTLRPWRRAMPAVAMTLAGTALAALWWRLSQRRLPSQVAASAAAPSAQAGAPGGSAGIPWVRLVALAWPLLPERWRARVSPATAGSLVALGLPLAEWLLHGRSAPPPATMPVVDLSQFAGSWFVVAQLPSHLGVSGAGLRMLSYTPRADGQLDVLAIGTDTRPDDAPTHSLAQIVPGSGGAKLALSRGPAWLRLLSLGWVDHWILHVDPDYTEALVGSADRGQLFMLSRRAHLPPQRHAAMLLIARERGYGVERLAPPRSAFGAPPQGGNASGPA